MSLNPVAAHPAALNHADTDSEAACLSAVLNCYCEFADLSRFVRTPAVFHDETFGAVYQAMAEIDRLQGPVDGFEVARTLKQLFPRRTDWTAVVTGLKAAAHTNNVESTGLYLVELSARRFVSRTAIRLTQALNDPASDVFEVADEIRQKMEAFQDGISSLHQPEPADLVSDWLREKEDERAGQTIPGVKTGIASWDRVVKALRAGQLHIIAARPSMGKTAVACQLAYNVASAGTGVAFFSLEMTTDELIGRLVGIESGYTNSEIGDVKQTDPRRLMEASGKIADLPLRLFDDVYSIAEIEQHARALKRKYGIGLVVVDYLQLVETDRRTGNREQEIADVSKRLKRLAKKLEIPVAALAQLNRSVEGRADKRPHLGDLRESGSIEQDADGVWMLYREAYYATKDEPCPDHLRDNLEIWGRKNRNGFITTEHAIECHYDAPTNRVWEWGRASPFSSDSWSRQFPQTEPGF